MRVYYSDHHEVILPPGHRFPMGKYAQLRRALLDGVVPEPAFVAAPLAQRDELILAHDPAYVDAFFAGTLDVAAMRTIGLPWSAALVARTRASAGGTLAAVRHARACGFAANLAGGTHHAAFDRGSGFCVFNDLAVAARWLLATNPAERVLVFDADVHQGDGTATLLANEPRTFTCSIHGARNFPFRKAQSSLDVELDDNAGDMEFLRAVRGAWAQAVAVFRPTFLLYQAGVDALESDKLGRLRVSHAGMRARDAFVFDAALALGVPTVMTLGGGYAEPISETVRAHVATYQEALQRFGMQPGCVERN